MKFSKKEMWVVVFWLVNGLQRGIDQMVKYCGDWNLKCNLQKTKILVFKKGGKFKKNEKWFMYDQLIEVAN
jgi:hypothetical protein